MTDPILWLRSLLFNVGWYAGTAVIAIVGCPILLLPRRAVVAWSRFWIRFVLGWLRLTVGTEAQNARLLAELAKL